MSEGPASTMITTLVLERDDCLASLWNKYSYDRLHLHLQKQFCELPHMSFSNLLPHIRALLRGLCAKNVGGSHEMEEYFGGFLVVATGNFAHAYTDRQLSRACGFSLFAPFLKVQLSFVVGSLKSLRSVHELVILFATAKILAQGL
ncbi:hypothetical protein ACFX2I_031203 [Malus domestica]